MHREMKPCAQDHTVTRERVRISMGPVSSTACAALCFFRNGMLLTAAGG